MINALPRHINGTSIRVPVHVLGISQIISYGLLFYNFAQLKAPLSEKLGVAHADILLGVTGAMVLQALLSPRIGSWVMIAMVRCMCLLLDFSLGRQA